jgi:endoglucanase
MTNAFTNLQKLTRAHGVSGNENEIRTLIRSKAEPYADEVCQDVMGNLIVHIKGRGAKIMFTAHMDTTGLVATHIDDDGFVSFATVGGLTAIDLVQQTFRFQNGTNAICVAREDKLPDIKVKDLYLDLGVRTGKQAKELIRPGDTAVYTNHLRQMAGNSVSGCYLDDRAGCLVLLQALCQIKNPANDLYFVFTTQEEVGTRGAKPAAFSVDPDYGIVVDVTAVDNVRGSLHEGTACVGKGAAIKIMDRSVICSNKIVTALREAAQERNIPVQSDIITCGGTDAGPMRTTRGGVITGGISIPCRYTHASVEMMDLDDVEACVNLVAAFCEKEQPVL